MFDIETAYWEDYDAQREADFTHVGYSTDAENFNVVAIEGNLAVQVATIRRKHGKNVAVRVYRAE